MSAFMGAHPQDRTPGTYRLTSPLIQTCRILIYRYTSIVFCKHLDLYWCYVSVEGSKAAEHGIKMSRAFQNLQLRNSPNLQLFFTKPNEWMLPLSNNPQDPLDLDDHVDISHSEMGHNEWQLGSLVQPLVQNTDVLLSSSRPSSDTLDRYNVTQPLRVLKRGRISKSPRQLCPLNTSYPQFRCHQARQRKLCIHRWFTLQQPMPTYQQATSSPVRTISLQVQVPYGTTVTRVCCFTQRTRVLKTRCVLSRTHKHHNPPQTSSW